LKFTSKSLLLWELLNNERNRYELGKVKSDLFIKINQILKSEEIKGIEKLLGILPLLIISLNIIRSGF